MKLTQRESIYFTYLSGDCVHNNKKKMSLEVVVWD